MPWHRDREDSATGADRAHASKRPRSAESQSDLSPEPVGNAALTRLMQSGRLPAPLSAAARAGNAAVARSANAATVQRAELPAQGAGPLAPETAAAIDAERGGGSPLPNGVRSEMEGHLGVDLSAVRVHTGQRADTLNRAVSAQAFTTGMDVFLSAGTYNPTSPAGRELLAHELTHVAQQASGTADTGARVSHPADAAEVEARDVAQRVMRSTPGPAPAPETRPHTAGIMDGRGKVAVVQRRGGADPPAKGLGTLSAEKSEGDVVEFMVAVGAYEGAAYDVIDQVPEPIALDGPLDEVAGRLLQTWTLVHQGAPDATEKFSAHWDRLRPDLDAVATWATDHGLDKDFDQDLVALYRRGVQRIENVFLLWYSDRAIGSRQQLADVGNPEAVYEQVIAKQVTAAANVQLAVVEKSEALLVKAGKLAKTGGDAIKHGGAAWEILRGSDKAGVPGPTAASSGAGAAAGTLSLSGLKFVLGTLAKAGSLKAKLDSLGKANDLKKSAFALDAVKLLVDTTHAVGFLSARAAMAAGAKEGEKLLALTGKLGSVGAKQIETASKAVGVVTSILGIASSTLTLIDAVQSGDEQKIAHGALDLAGGVANLGLAFAGGGAVPGVIVGGYVFMWKLMVDIMGQLGGLLKRWKLEAKAERAAAMVHHAAEAAATGRRMVTAWDEAQVRAATGSRSTEAKAAEVLEARAYQEMAELGPQMNRVLQLLGGFRDDDDVAVEIRKDLAGHLLATAIDFGRTSGQHHPYEVTELCRIVFADVNAVVNAIATGHAP